MNIDPLTPQQAAERAKVSRATIVRALQDRDLQGIRSNSGRWSINPEDVDRWAKRRMKSVHARPVNTDHVAEISLLSNQLTHLLSEQLNTARQEIAERDARLARLEAEAAIHAAQMAGATRDRDAWREQAQRLAERSAPHPAPDERDQPRGLRLFRLFRRSG